MGDSSSINRVLLGSGGCAPRVDFFSPETESVTRLVRLAQGQSVYAIAQAPYDQDVAVFATKGGSVSQLRDEDGSSSEGDTRVADLRLRTPILAICYVDTSQVAISDATGRCCLWKVGSEIPFVDLEGKDRVVCSLLKLDESRLMGLAVTGELLFWDLHNGRLVGTVLAAPPPTRAASVHLYHWRAHNAVAYPGAGGDFVLYLPESGEVRQITAHQGDFYALFVIEDDLLTVGAQDARLKRWEVESDTPVAEFTAPSRVISGAPLYRREPMLLLIRENGRAGIYSFAEEELQLRQLLPGDDYRTVVGPSWDSMKSHATHHRAEEARQIAIHIQDGLQHAPTEDLERSHDRLVELGYEHVSLALRAECAHRQEDIVAELRAYQSLFRVLPQDHSEMARSLERYAGLLEHVWQMTEAQHVYRRLVAIGHDCSVNIERLSPYVQGLTIGTTVIETAVPVSTIMNAAQLFDSPVSARFLIKALDPVQCGGARLDPEQIVAKYEQVRCADKGASLPTATWSRVHWLTPSTAHEVDLVTFGDSECDESNGLQFGLKIVCAHVQSVVVPVVLMDPACDATGPRESMSPRLFITDPGNRVRSNGWLSRIHHAACQALRRLITQALAGRTQ